MTPSVLGSGATQRERIPRSRTVRSTVPAMGARGGPQRQSARLADARRRNFSAGVRDGHRRDAAGLAPRRSQFQTIDRKSIGSDRLRRAGGRAARDRETKNRAQKQAQEPRPDRRRPSVIAREVAHGRGRLASHPEGQLSTPTTILVNIARYLSSDVRSDSTISAAWTVGHQLALQVVNLEGQLFRVGGEHVGVADQSPGAVGFLA